MLIKLLVIKVLLLKEVDFDDSRKTEDDYVLICDFWSSPITKSASGGVISPFRSNGVNLVVFMLKHPFIVHGIF